MDGSGQYRTSSRHHHPFNHSPQLPPPSQLHLSSTGADPSSSGFRSNTLPPISSLQQQQQQQQPLANHHRSSYSYTPSTNGTANGTQLPPLPSPSSSSWGHHHRTSSSRDELHPAHYPPQESPHQQHPQQQQQQHHTHHRGDMPVRKDSGGVKREALPPAMHHHAEQHAAHNGHAHQQAQQVQVPSTPVKETEDGMPATSDFVKKLFKCVSPYPILLFILKII